MAHAIGERGVQYILGVVYKESALRVKRSFSHQRIPKTSGLFGRAIVVRAHHVVKPLSQGQSLCFHSECDWVGIGDQHHIKVARAKVSQKRLGLRAPANPFAIGSFDSGDIEC